MRRLRFEQQPVDLSHLRERWMREVWQGSRAGSLPEHDSPVRARVGDTASLGLCRGRLCPSFDPEQDGWEIGRVALSCDILNSGWGERRKRDGTWAF